MHQRPRPGIVTHRPIMGCLVAVGGLRGNLQVANNKVAAEVEAFNLSNLDNSTRYKGFTPRRRAKIGTELDFIQNSTCPQCDRAAF